MNILVASRSYNREEIKDEKLKIIISWIHMKVDIVFLLKVLINCERCYFKLLNSSPW